MASVWVIEDDPSIRTGLVRAIGNEGHTVETASSIAEADALVGAPHLVMLDLTLPDGDGLDWCRTFTRAHPAARVIMVTARDTEMDKVTGLDSGAIDYLAKPFGLAELLARVRAQLRHAGARDGGQGLVFTVRDLRIDVGARRVWLDGHEVELRAREFDLLARLAEDAGEVVRREDLMADVWGIDWDASSKTLDVHVAALRRRLGEESPKDSRITTLRHVGYRLER